MTPTDAQLHAVVRRRKRARAAALMARGNCPPADIAEICSLSPESVRRICAAEMERRNIEILDAREPWEVVSSWVKPTPPFKELRVPAHPPTNICIDCLRRWISALDYCRKEQLEQRRAVECPHWGDGLLLRAAFIRQGKVAPQWIELTDIEPSDWNRVYFMLCFTNAERIALALDLMKKRLAPLAERICRQVGAQVGAQVQQQRRAELGAVVLAVARAL